MAQSCCASLWTKAEFWSRLVSPLVLLLLAVNRCAEAVALDAVSFQLPAPPALTGALVSNNVLLDAEQIHAGQVGTPHSYTAYGDNMYAVTDRGQVVNVAPCRPVVVATLRTRGCQSTKDCGHLVSIRLSPDNLLLVLDAYQGLFEVHPYTGVVRLLYDARTLVNGRPSVYLNDFAFLNDGTLVLSEASPTFDYDNEFWIRFEGRPDGRLLTYNSTSGQAKEILAGISYPTGVELTDDGKALLVSEAGRARILRISLSKDKFLQRSYFSENLPGMPEHIRKSGRGTYWVGLSYPRYRGEVSITDQYSSKPTSRNFLAVRRTKEQLQLMYTKRGLAIEVDGSGKILRSFHDPTGLKIAEVLELVEYSAVLYVGTRAQSSTVRIVGSPNSLTVDSLVQVLRGRCQVSEDRIQETKVSLEQQLKARKNMGSGDNSPSPRRVSISQGLSELHRTLIGGPQRHAQTYPHGYESNYGPPYKQDGHNVAPPYHQQGPNMAPPYQYDPNMPPPYQQIGHSIPAGPHRPGRIQPNRNPPPHQKTSAFEDPFLPANGPQVDVSLQRANRLPSGHHAQQSRGSSNQPHVVHSLHKGELISHVILGKKAEAALAGSMLSPQVSPSQNENPASPPPVRAEPVSPTPQRQVDAVPRQKAPEDIAALGGFLGFMDSNARAGTPIGSENQQAKQSPIVPISMPDQKAPGHLEPLHSIISPPASQTDQQSHSGASFPGLELFTGSQDVARQHDISANRPQPAGSSSSSRQLGTSFAGNGQKQHGPDVVDMPNVIQNMQMFHPPTDRPDNSAQSQNIAAVKLGSNFQRKASLLKQGLQQLQQIFQESPPAGQSPTQLIPAQKESRSKAQEATALDPVEAGLSTVQRTNNGNRDAATSVTNQQTRISNSDATAPQDTPKIPVPNGVINVNHAHLTKQPLTPFSRAAAIHRNQPTNNIFEKRFSAIIQTRIGAMQGGVVTNTNSPMQVTHGQFPKNINSGIHANDSQSATDVTSATQTSRPHPSLLSVQPASSRDTRPNMTQAIQESNPASSSAASNSGTTEQVQQPPSLGKMAPTGYIQVYQSPGQYILIPLTQASLIQALRGISASQVKGAQIVTTNTGASQQSTAANQQPASSSLPTEATAPRMEPEHNLTQLQTHRQEFQPSHEFSPPKSQTEGQNGHMVLQDSKIHDPNLQNQQQLHQGQPQRFVQYEQRQQQLSGHAMATPQSQHWEDNARRPPISDVNFRQEQHNSFASSNSEQIIASTQPANTNATPTPKWFTYNSDQKDGQSTQHFTQPSQQITRPAQQGIQLTQEFPQPTQQFAQAANQFSPPAQQFNQQTRQFAQSNQYLSQPARQLTQSTHQFTQPTQLFTQPAQQFTQQTDSIPNRYATSNIAQPSTQHFSTQPASTSIQQKTQEYNKYPTHQPPQHVGNFSVSRITKFPTQHQIQPSPGSNTSFNQQNPQGVRRQQTDHNLQDVTQQSPKQAINRTSTQEQIQQEAVWQAPHFTQDSQQDAIQQFNQQRQNPNSGQSSDQSVQHLSQQIIQQPRPHISDSVRESQQTFTGKDGQYSTQRGVQVFTQLPVEKLNDNSRQHLTQPPLQISSQPQTQQPPIQFSQSIGQFTEHPTYGFNQTSVQNTAHLLNSHLTPHVTQQFSNHATQQSFDQPVRQPPQQLNNDLSRQVPQQPAQQSSQQFNSYLTPHYSGQPAEQKSQQFSNHVSSHSTEQPRQQLNSHPTLHNLEQPVQPSSQQFNSYSTPQILKQPVQTSPQQFNSYSTPQILEQPVQTSPQQFNSYSTPQILKQPVQTSPQQFNSYSTPQILEQPVQTSPQQFNSYSTPQILEQPVQTSPQQFSSYSTPHNLGQPVQISSQQLISSSPPHVSLPPVPQTAQQLTTQSKSQYVEQRNPTPTHQFNPFLTHHTSEQHKQQSYQQTVPQTTTNHSLPAEDIHTKLTHGTTPLFTQPTAQQSLQYSNNPSSQQFTQQSFQQLSNQSSQHLAQQSTQLPQPTDQNNDKSARMSQPSQFPQERSDESARMSRPSQFPQQRNDESTRYVTQQSQFPQQRNDESTRYVTQQSQFPQQRNDESTRYVTQQSQFPQQRNDESTRYVTQQSQFPQQRNDESTRYVTQQSQFPQQRNDESTRYVTQQSQFPQQRNDESTRYVTQQSQFPQQRNDESTRYVTQQSQFPQQRNDESTRYVTQQSQFPQQRNDESTRHVTQQSQTSSASQSFVPQLIELSPQPSQSSAQYQTQPPRPQPPRQLINTSLPHLQSTTQQHSDDSTQFIHRPTQLTSQQTMEPTENINAGTAQHFTYQPTRSFSQPSSRHPAMGTEDPSTRFTQRTSQHTSQHTSQQTMEPTENIDAGTAHHFTYQPTRPFSQPSSRHPAMGTEDPSTRFTQRTSQHTSQQTMEPTENIDAGTAHHFTYQPTRPFSQPSSRHPAMGTEDPSTRFTQRTSQHTSQQTMGPTQNIDADTAQHFTYQPTRPFSQPSPRHPAMGSEDRSHQFTQQTSQQPSQQTSQQASQQPSQQTILPSTQVSSQTTQTKQSVNTDTSQYLTRTPPQLSRRTTQTTEKIVELPNELFTPQPAQDVELRPSNPVPRP